MPLGEGENSQVLLKLFKQKAVWSDSYDGNHYTV